MLKEIGMELVMIGHSERRHVFGETDAAENKKVKAALAHGFTTLLCIGETGEEKEYGISAEVLRTQLKIGFHNVPVEQTGKIWVAYEPVWSIGVNGTPASADYAEDMHKVIKECLNEIFGEAGSDIPVLYGGSVNPSNADELIVQPSIDGLFTGRAAWQADKFNDLIRSAKATYKQATK
jgi:triosephosphate isomerase